PPEPTTAAPSAPLPEPPAARPSPEPTPEPTPRSRPPASRLVTPPPPPPIETPPEPTSRAAASFWDTLADPGDSNADMGEEGGAEPMIESVFDASQSEGYSYFLSEAQDLLLEMEQQLLSLSPSKETNEIYTLMRATHTIKGAAANVGQDTIKTVAHQLEDIFRALLVPEAVLDAELEARLFEGYECLRRSLNAELSQDTSTRTAILRQSQDIWERCRTKLGDCFDQEPALPSSSDLGFDLTRSIFEVGVNQRLDELTAALGNNTDAARLAQMLREHAAVFAGLGESLSLPGFQAIATMAIAALDAHPDRSREIVSVAYEDLQVAQAAVMAGDRTQGGQPSPELQELAGGELDATPIDPFEISPAAPTAATDLAAGFDELTSADWNGDDLELAGLDLDDLALAPADAADTLDLDADTTEDWLGEDDLSVAAPSLEATFGELELDTSELDDSEAAALDDLFPEPSARSSPPAASFATLDDDLDELSGGGWEEGGSHSATAITPPAPPPPVATELSSPSRPSSVKTIRLELDQLEHLNHLVAELSINQNQLVLRDEQFYQAAQKLDNWLKRHRYTLMQLRDRLLETSQQLTPTQKLAFTALEETGQLLQAAEDINLLARVAAATVEREQRLATQLRDNMQAARMVPIATVLNRLPPLVKQLTATYGKMATLHLSGTKVMVDKTMTANLYDALLHLVRNAFAHGIETPAERRRLGKSVTGRIEIQAFYQGNRTIVEVRDDGSGLDAAAICRRAVERRLLSAGRAAEIQRQPDPDAALLELLCEPGFSTAQQTDDLAGRGVGLDVVKTQLTAIKGTLSVRSRPGQGTTFALQIRESLMSARLLICQAGSGTYGFVSNEIEQVLIPTNGYTLHHLARRKVLDWQQDGAAVTVPIYELASLLPYANQRLERLHQMAADTTTDISPLLNTPDNVAPILLLRAGDRWFGLEVNRVIEEQELVIKPITNALQPPAYVYGCSILADGKLILVLDGTTLVSNAEPPIADPSSPALPAPAATPV
ncbi:MAG: hypothetical protein HC910_23035, partial [Spirulinaceae cyanobacterium SM2_1_0]|nr:hypothetical protein [Spirulinaceae cyanobacterium SM2_1_0]